MATQFAAVSKHGGTANADVFNAALFCYLSTAYAFYAFAVHGKKTTMMVTLFKA